MDITEIFSLLMLVLAYVIIIMLIVIYEVTECQFSRLHKCFVSEIFLHLSNNITNNFISLLPSHSLLSLS